MLPACCHPDQKLENSHKSQTVFQTVFTTNTNKTECLSLQTCIALCTALIYAGKAAEEELTSGLSYSAAMKLQEIPLLESGYQDFMDSFFYNQSRAIDRCGPKNCCMSCGTVW